jgi:Fatty acid desaturase
MKNTYQTSIRESMKILPTWSQPLITWLTGKPYEGQSPLTRSTPILETVSTLILLSIYLFLAKLIVETICNWYGYFTLFPIWILIAGRLRKIQVTLCHHAVHATLTNNKYLDMMLMELLSTIIFVQGYKEYFNDHVLVHHNPKKQCTMDDPDLQFLIALGISPGKKKSELWRALINALFSPYVHYLFLRARIVANFIAPPLYRKVMTLIYWVIILLIVYLLKGGWLVLMVWIIPLTVFYHISAMLQFVCEHRWLNIDLSVRGRERVAKMNLARFCGEKFPTHIGKSILEKVMLTTVWFVKMIFYHLIVRLYILVGDLPVHDFHHRNPGRKGDWANSIYARQKDIEKSTGVKPIYTEKWGLHNAINEVFTVLSELPQQSIEKLSKTNCEGLLGM